MATIKVASLLIRTLAKPVSATIKERAKNHPSFRAATISLAQFMHKSEMNMRVGLLGTQPGHIRPLNDAKAIEQGANFISEAFVFLVAVSIILAETLRGRRNTANRRDKIDDKLEELTQQIGDLSRRLEPFEKSISDVHTSNDQLTKLVDSILDVGLRGGWISRALDKDAIDASHPRTVSNQIGSIASEINNDGQLPFGYNRRPTIDPPRESNNTENIDKDP